MLKQSLDNGLDPIIISDNDKMEYYSSLNQYKETKSVQMLTRFLLEESELFKEKASPFLLPKGKS